MYVAVDLTNAMTEMSIDRVYARKIAHAYIALALAQDEARRYLKKNSSDRSLQPLLFSLDVTAELLEEVLQSALPEVEPLPAPPMTCSEMLM